MRVGGVVRACVRCGAHTCTPEKCHPASNKKVAPRPPVQWGGSYSYHKKVTSPLPHRLAPSDSRILHASVDERSSHPLSSTSIGSPNYETITC